MEADEATRMILIARNKICHLKSPSIVESTSLLSPVRSHRQFAGFPDNAPPIHPSFNTTKMRRTLLVPLIAAPIATAFLIPSNFHGSLSRYLPQSLQPSTTPPIHNQQQSPMNPGPVQPPNTGGNPSSDTSAPSDGGADLTISDILPLSRSINIFAQLTRDIASVTARLSTNTAAANTTLLAPLNSAMQDLPRKPWEDRPGDKTGVSAERNEEKASENLRRFVEAHVVPASPWKIGEDGKVETLGGGEVWWEEREGKRVVCGKGFEVEVGDVVGTVGNGEIWAIKGVVNYE